MKITVQHKNMRSYHDLDSLIEERILSLESRLQIDEANVSLECRCEASPPFSARIHLVTPGPDVVAESQDHTIRAAIDEAIAELENKISDRFEKRRRRLRSNLQKSGPMRMGDRRS
jgi:ribosome-associated translation inhibitor RaiA